MTAFKIIKATSKNHLNPQPDWLLHSFLWNCTGHLDCKSFSDQLCNKRTYIFSEDCCFEIHFEVWSLWFWYKICFIRGVVRVSMTHTCKPLILLHATEVYLVRGVKTWHAIVSAVAAFWLMLWVFFHSRSKILQFRIYPMSRFDCLCIN